PDDPAVGVWAANFGPGAARAGAFRGVTTRFPNYGPGYHWLAYYLSSSGSDSITRANADEAMRAASSAVRLTPNESSAHAMMAFVLTQNGHFAEAKQHLDAAEHMSPVSEWAYYVRAQIATFEGNMPAMRAALDTALASQPNVGQRGSARA